MARKRKREKKDLRTKPCPYWSTNVEAFASSIPSVVGLKEVGTDQSLVPRYGSWFKAKTWQSPRIQPASLDILKSTVERRWEPPGEKRLKGAMGRPTLAARHGQTATVQVISIPLRPSKEQRASLRNLFGICRATYNRCVKAERIGIPANESDYRRRFVGRIGVAASRKTSFLRVPQRVREKMVSEYFQGRKAAFSNLKAGNIEKFYMKFRSRRDRQESVTLSAREFTQDGHFLRSFFEKCNVDPHIKMDIEVDTRKPPCDVRLVRKVDKYFLIWPRIQHGEPKLRAEHISNACGVDPGDRSMVTVYGTDGIVTSVGDNGRRFKILLTLDGLISLRDLAKNRKREARGKEEARLLMFEIGRLTRKIERWRCKFKNLIKDIHCRVAKYLSSYDVVVYPPFSSKQIIEQCPLRTKTCRGLYSWAHYALRMRVKQKVELCGGYFFENQESYTSKTCTECGCINEIGSKESWVCIGCGAFHLRDPNGAKGVLCRFVDD